MIASAKTLHEQGAMGCLAVLVSCAVLVGPGGAGPGRLPLAAKGPSPGPKLVPPVDPESLVPLYRRLEDPDEAVRDRAFRTLLRMGAGLPEHHFRAKARAKLTSPQALRRRSSCMWQSR